jgi:hypothetical protein
MKALEMVHDDSHSAAKLQEYLNRLETELSRNERAALAFVIIQNLLEK